MFKRIHSLLNVFVIISLAVPWTSIAPAQPAMASAPQESRGSTGVYRARITYPNALGVARLADMGITLLAEGPDPVLSEVEGWAVVLVNETQLETLARLRFTPTAIDELGVLIHANAVTKPWLRDSLNPTLRRLIDLHNQVSSNQITADAAQADIQAVINAITAEQSAGITALTSLDDDADGLTNTQESWWCTDPLDADSDGDGYTDGAEVQAAKDWLANEAASYPASGKPFQGWPVDHEGCFDDDLDSIPDLAERWELGLNMNLESTDRDKFDDGQEIFGLTYCPGSGGFCGYGVLPRNEDWGVLFSQMPSWVESPGNHPLVAAYPIIEIDVLPSSLRVETVTIVTTDHSIAEGTEKSYSTAKTEGISTSIANTTTWNEWEETSVTQPTFINQNMPNGVTVAAVMKGLDYAYKTYKTVDAFCSAADSVTGEKGTCGKYLRQAGSSISSEASQAVSQAKKYVSDTYATIRNEAGNLIEKGKDWVDKNLSVNSCTVGFPPSIECEILFKNNKVNADTSTLNRSAYSNTDQVGGLYANQLHTDGNSTDVYRYYPLAYPQPVNTITESKGKSWGGAQTTTNTQYEEHTVTNGEAFSDSESWGTATAIDSSHTADLWFSYIVSNEGTEYAREICDLAFNIYIGDPSTGSGQVSNPAYTYFVANDVGGDGCFNNFMPGESHNFSSKTENHAIPLSLAQMKAIDLGAALRVVVEDYTYGIDELFYEDAANAGVQIAIEDGTDDGDESIDNYLIPTWGEETVMDVLARYFPHDVDAEGDLIAIWTPEYRSDTPAWCVEPQVVGIGSQRALWCKHALSTADWWNVYLNGLGDGTEPFQDTPASPGSVALFRFNKDSDLDGYSDRSELRLGTDPDDPADYPRPELLAGVHSIQVGDYVTATLSLLNTGLYDAYGVEAIMIAPDDSIEIINNTVGGSGRVRALKDVVVGSRVLPPDYDDLTWSGTALPNVSGYFTGTQDIDYALTVDCANPGGCEVGSGTWSLDWTDDQGGSGSLDLGAGYDSPTPLDMGDSGVQVGLLSGTAANGDHFAVEARTPRDTFQFQINRQPYTDPIVIVSYNDPQGNHRFMIPPESMDLSTPGDDLSTFAGEMLHGSGVEIVTTDPFDPLLPAPYSLDLIINNPISATLENAHLFLEFIDITGTVVSEVPFTTTIQAGPNVRSLGWDTTDFDPAYTADQDYIVMVFWTDYQGNILDTAARPLSSFQDDPRPAFATDNAGLRWNFGEARQGTLLQRQFVLASVGYMDLLTYMGGVTGMTVSGPASEPLSPGDMGVYTMTINTEFLPVGVFTRTIPIRTSDPEHPTREVVIQGEITPYTPDGTQSITLRPLDWDAVISGDHSQGEWVTYTHNLGPDPQTLHPVKVYSEDYTTPWGMGKYATDFGEGTEPFDIFGYGSDGPISITTNTTDNPIDSPASGISGTHVLTATNSSFAAGQKILIHQTRSSTLAGYWELNEIQSYVTGTITTVDPLDINYSSSGNDRAQVLVVKEYTNVIINGGATWTSKAWNGTTGGILAFLSNGTTTVNGTISANGTGYRGGEGVTNTAQGKSGGGTTGPSTSSTAANGTGHGGPNNNGHGGGGGGHASSVAAKGGGEAAGTSGTTDLSIMTFGGGGASGWELSTQATRSGAGGNGGGIVFASADTLTMGESGAITSNGADGGNCNSSDHAGEGGGGAGGSVFIRVRTATLGTSSVTALRGSGSDHDGTGGHDSFGTDGSEGRIHLEHCDFLSGSTDPTTTPEKLNCYITEQVESPPYTTTRLKIPETFNNGQIYKIQYGRRYVFTDTLAITQSIRIPKQLYTAMSLESLVSNTGASSGGLNLSVDIGNDGTLDWTHNQPTDFPVNLTITDTVDALNAYLISRTDIDWNADIDVPVRVVIDRQADVILTDLELSLQFNQPAGLSSVDLSADRPLDWLEVISGTYAQGYPYTFTHTLEPDAVSIHPCKVYDMSGTDIKGVGKHCTDFGEGTTSYAMFGDGSDGDFIVSTGQISYTDNIRSALASTAPTGQNEITLSNASDFSAGKEVLIIQMQGTGAGSYEFGVIDTIIGDTLTLHDSITNTYTIGGNSKAQVIQVPHYHDVTILSGGKLTTHSWKGVSGGIVALRASGNVLVEGVIDVSENGYRGGDGGTYGATAKQGESYNGLGGTSTNRNSGGGGGGQGSYDADGADGGGGGGYGSWGGSGSNGGGGLGETHQPGQDGAPYGTSNLDEKVFLGSGGGGGGGYHENGLHWVGGNGGGIILIFANNMEVSGFIKADGEKGEDSNSPLSNGRNGSGGGGSGGSVYITIRIGDLGVNNIHAVGGIKGVSSGEGGDGGNGGVGYIQIDFQNLTNGWATSPPANQNQMNFFSIEQIEDPPYSTVQLYMPENVTGGGSYLIQFGRHYVFTNTLSSIGYLRLSRQMYGAASLDALVSNTTSGAMNLCIDVGNDGVCDFTDNTTTEFPTAITVTTVTAPLNDYLTGRTDVPWGNPVDVPVRVSVDRAADVMLTNLALTPVGVKTRYIRLPARDYSNLTFSLEFGQESDPAGPIAFTVDVGADGTIDWTASGSGAFPAAYTSPNLAAVFNAYLAGRSGEVDVPIRIIPSPFLKTTLAGFSARPSQKPDATLEAGDIGFSTSSPTEGNQVTVTAALHNDGGLDTEGVTASFFATSPDFGEYYIGSDFVADIPAGGTANAVLDWNTLGFTGEVPVRVYVDPFDRLSETLENNNQATANLTILTRPDLLVTEINPPESGLVLSQTITTTLSVGNTGQTDAGSPTFSLYDGNPDDGGVLIGELSPTMPAGSAASLEISWQPDTLGEHRLFAVSDSGEAVNESDEGNNQTWQDVYVGFAGPLLLDSGITGEQAYAESVGYGYVDEGQGDFLTTCGEGTRPEETIRLDPLGEVVYRFDHLLPDHFYHLDLTLYECDGAGRQEYVYVDENLITGSEDLGDGQVHRISILLDPALYADHRIRVGVLSPGIDGAIVSEVNLHDIDYRYADSGGDNDPEYPGEDDYGYIDGIKVPNWGSLPYQSVRIDQGDNEVSYRFDRLDPTKNYKLHFTFWQPSGTGRIQKVQVDGEDTGLGVDTWDYQIHHESIDVPVSAYAGDSSIVVSIIRMDADTGAMVNEIAIEEETLPSGGVCVVQRTPSFTLASGNVTISGQPAPVGTVIQALNIRGDTVGCFTVSTSGEYHYMRIFGEDTSVNPPNPGMRDGEMIIFKVNGMTAVATPLLYWHNDFMPHNIDLNAGTVRRQSILQEPEWNLISFNIEPPYPLVSIVLQSIDSRYDRVLGENGAYDPDLDDIYNTLKELHGGEGYYLHMDSSTYANLLVEGLSVPADTPIPLHQGWNWIGYLPEATLPITQALQSIDGQYQLVHSLTKTYDPNDPTFSTLADMSPGNGFLLYANSAISLTYPISGDAVTMLPAGETVDRCSGISPTPFFSVIYGWVYLDGEPAPAGTRVEVITERGEVAGCYVLGEPGLLKMTHVYGAEGDGRAGFLPDEVLSYRVNGILIPGDATIRWVDDKTPHEVTLLGDYFHIYFPLVRR